jgi:hypothetical protein
MTSKVAIITGGSHGIEVGLVAGYRRRGVFISKPFTDYIAADYAKVTGVILTGFFWLTQRVIGSFCSPSRRTPISTT